MEQLGGRLGVLSQVEGVKIRVVLDPIVLLSSLNQFKNNAQKEILNHFYLNYMRILIELRNWPI